MGNICKLNVVGNRNFYRVVVCITRKLQRFHFYVHIVNELALYRINFVVKSNLEIFTVFVNVGNYRL